MSSLFEPPRVDDLLLNQQSIMKQVLTFVLAVLLTGSAFAQNIIEKNFTRYQNQDNFTTINVSGKMFEMAVYLEDDENDSETAEMLEFLQSITSFNMIVGEKVQDIKGTYTSAVKTVANTHEELMSIDDNDGRATFFIDESNGIVRELVLVGRGNDEFVVFSLMGEIDLRQLSKMSSKIQQQGFRQMDKMFENGVQDVKVYPNPAQANSEITIEVPEQMIGGMATIYNMDGKSVQTTKINGSKEQVSINRLPAGSYVVEMKKDKISIKKRILVQ